MKANIETIEPVIRPVSIRTAPAVTAPRATRTIAAFAPVRAESALFHAWRA